MSKQTILACDMDDILSRTAAADLGMSVMLFCDYSWNQAESLPGNVTGCKDWKEVGGVF